MLCSATCCSSSVMPGPYWPSRTCFCRRASGSAPAGDPAGALLRPPWFPVSRTQASHLGSGWTGQENSPGERPAAHPGGHATLQWPWLRPWGHHDCSAAPESHWAPGFGAQPLKSLPLCPASSWPQPQRLLPVHLQPSSGNLHMPLLCPWPPHCPFIVITAPLLLWPQSTVPHLG